MQREYWKSRIEMQLRRIEKRDVKKLFEIWKENYSFPFPDINNPLYAFQHVVLDDHERIVLGSFVKLTSEGIFITDKEVNSITRMKAIKIAMNNMNLIWN